MAVVVAMLLLLPLHAGAQSQSELEGEGGVRIQPDEIRGMANREEPIGYRSGRRWPDGEHAARPARG